MKRTVGLLVILAFVLAAMTAQAEEPLEKPILRPEWGLGLDVWAPEMVIYWLAGGEAQASELRLATDWLLKRPWRNANEQAVAWGMAVEAWQDFGTGMAAETARQFGLSLCMLDLDVNPQIKELIKLNLVDHGGWEAALFQ